jgi:lysozyme family protein
METLEPVITLKFEGSKSNDPRDPGGHTNQDVTQRTYVHAKYAVAGISTKQKDSRKRH